MKLKRILLLCLAALLLMQGVCLAKIKKGEDKFEGDYWYYVYHAFTNYETAYLGSQFTVYFTRDGVYDGKGFNIDFENDGTYALDDTVKMQIDDTIYTWTTTGQSRRSNGSVDRSFPLPNNVYEALMKTKNNVAIRFFYKSLSGDYRKDYVIPYKIIKEAQTMFDTYVPKTEIPAQPAK